MNFLTIEISNPDFEIENCKIYHYRNEDDFRINVFFLKANSDIIDKNWKRFSNIVAANYQTSEYMSNKEFDRWNFYIVYMSKDKVSKELQNKIENDKFSSRKIVEDSYNNVFNDDEANRLIIKHITNADLKEIVEETLEVAISEYIPKNGNLWKLLLDEEKLIGDRKAQEAFVKKINTL
ncbi:ABC-three component system middle component 1 [Myroides sp.]|uniref:ABC-three component system middle component 1 n=1 Tax=Myroides sp. TaxID=1874736 RepID=UPI0028AE727C|nr:ABC-three component system middle component 1 [Myroides sp.]